MNFKRKAMLGLLATSVAFTPMLAGAETMEQSQNYPVNAKTTEAVSAVVDNSFPDIEGHWAKSSIESLVAEGVIHGYPDGTFKPNDPIKRAEATKMIIAEKGYELLDQPSKFPDVEENYWAEEYINIATDEGIIAGYPDGTFKPTNKLTRGELSAILVRAYGLEVKDENAKLPYPDVDKNYWGYEDILALHQNGVAKGFPNGDFAPLKEVTRAEFVSFLKRIINADSDVEPTEPTEPSKPNEPEEPELEIVSFDFDFPVDLTVGQEETIKLLVTFDNGETKDITKESTFETEDSKVAVVENGKLKAVSEGKTNIIVDYEGNTAVVSITVKEAHKEEKPNDEPKIGDKVDIKGFIFTYQGSGYWEDEAGVWTSKLPEPYDIPIGNGVYSFTDDPDPKSDYAIAQNFIIGFGFDLTKEQFLDALATIRETGEPVTVNGYTFKYDEESLKPTILIIVE